MSAGANSEGPDSCFEVPVKVAHSRAGRAELASYCGTVSKGESYVAIHLRTGERGL
jgi:hypothetical protein